MEHFDDSTLIVNSSIPDLLFIDPFNCHMVPKVVIL